MSASEQWNLNQERVFLENLMQTRFNFFLVAFGFWMVGAEHMSDKFPKLIFLVTGTLICFLLWLTIQRICEKVLAVLKMIHDDDSHPMTMVAAKSKTSGFPSVSANHLIGYVIPLICIFFIFSWSIYCAVELAVGICRSTLDR